MTFLYFASDTFESRAKVLTESIKKYHPEAKIVHVKPVDGPLGTYIPNMAKYRLESALRLLEAGEEIVCIIGADCELFSKLDFLSFYNTDVFIVPHVKKPLADRKYMTQIYETGHANADFICLRNCDNSRNILKWLISVTEDGKEPGAFYEQTWLSALPFLFYNVTVLKNSGMNVGYWEVNHVDFDYSDGQYYIDGELLTMFQYSGYVKGESMKMSRHSKERCENPIAFKIYKDYDDRIDQ